MTPHDPVPSPPTTALPAVPDAAPRVLDLRPAAGPVRRAVQLTAGLVLYALSIAMLVHSALGNMPWDVLTQGVSRRAGWSFGTITVLVSVLVLVCWWPLRQRPGIGTVANVAVIGVLVDPFLALLDQLPDPLAMPARVALVVGGIGANALASALYIGTRLGPGPRDGLMTGLVGRTGWPVGPVRAGIEATVVAVGWLLGGTVGFATLAYALAIGPLIHVLLPRLSVRVAPHGSSPRVRTDQDAGTQSVLAPGHAAEQARPSASGTSAD